MPERICWFQTQWHIAAGPFSLKIWSETDPLTGKIVAWVMGGWETRAPMTIWMDGRPHPSKNAPHDQTGFTTGTWNGDVLTAYTTHIKTGYIRRNGAASSDQATITTTFFRHGDMMTLALVMEDPVYLTEPYILTRSYMSTPTPVAVGGPALHHRDMKEWRRAGFRIIFRGRILSWMKWTKLYHIPKEAAMGGAETMYPAFRDKIKDKFVIPPKCKRNCGRPRRGRRRIRRRLERVRIA